MRRYGQQIRLGRRGGLVIRVHDEYVHDCAIECPDGHQMWSNVRWRAEEIALIVPVPDGAGQEEIDAAIANAKAHSRLWTGLGAP